MSRGQAKAPRPLVLLLEGVDDPRNSKADLAGLTPEEKRARFLEMTARIKLRVKAASLELVSAGEGSRAVLLQSTRRMFRQALISPDSYGDPAKPWRATDLEDGQPTGHDVYGSREEALQSHAGIWFNRPPNATAYEYFPIRSDRPAAKGSAPRSPGPALHVLLGQLARLAAPDFNPRTWVGAHPTWAMVKPEHVSSLAASHSGSQPPEVTVAALQPFFDRLLVENQVNTNPLTGLTFRAPAGLDEPPGFPQLTPPAVQPALAFSGPEAGLD